MQKNSGIILLSVISIVSVLSIIALYIFQTAYGTAKLCSSYVMSQALVKKQSEILLNNLAAESRNGNFRCISQDASNSIYKICFIDSIKNEVINDNYINQIKDCSIDENQNFSQTNFGHIISSLSLVSGKTCKDETLHLNSNQKFLGNLSAKNMVLTSTDSPLIIIINGWLEIDHLLLRSSAIIISASDIFINQINTDSKGIELYLYSISGKIKIQNSDESINIKGKSKISAVGISQNSEQISPDYLKIARIIHSISRQRENL